MTASTTLRASLRHCIRSLGARNTTGKHRSGRPSCTSLSGIRSVRREVCDVRGPPGRVRNRLSIPGGHPTSVPNRFGATRSGAGAATVTASPGCRDRLGQAQADCRASISGDRRRVDGRAAQCGTPTGPEVRGVSWLAATAPHAPDSVAGARRHRRPGDDGRATLESVGSWPCTPAPVGSHGNNLPQAHVPVVPPRASSGTPLPISWFRAGARWAAYPASPWDFDRRVRVAVEPGPVMVQGLLVRAEGSRCGGRLADPILQVAQPDRPAAARSSPVRSTAAITCNWRGPTNSSLRKIHAIDSGAGEATTAGWCCTPRIGLPADQESPVRQSAAGTPRRERPSSDDRVSGSATPTTSRRAATRTPRGHLSTRTRRRRGLEKPRR